MIRTEDTITSWQKWFAAGVDDLDLRTKILASQALLPLERAFLTHERKSDPIYSDWYGDGSPVAFNTQVTKYEIEVIYYDFDTKQYYIGPDGKLKKQYYDGHNRDVRMWELPMEANDSWHKWDMVREHDVLMRKMSENTTTYLITFVDSLTNTRYAFQTYTFGFKI